MAALESLQERLLYTFSNSEVLRLALRHRSTGKLNNERLEFLGDSILGFHIANLLFQCLPEAREGELSRHRAQLVQKNTLAEIARELELGACLELGQGERNSGGAERDSILADTLEALISAVYLDGGLASCQAFIERLYQSRLQLLSQTEPLQKDAKTRLQELLQAKKFSLPNYEVVQVAGRDHQQSFTVSCTINETGSSFVGKGLSRRDAEQQAAAAALKKLDS